MSGYRSLTWIRDNEGRELVCEAEKLNRNFKDGDVLSDEEKKSCSDVSQIVGTERW